MGFLLKKKLKKFGRTLVGLWSLENWHSTPIYALKRYKILICSAMAFVYIPFESPSPELSNETELILVNMSSRRNDATRRQMTPTV